MRVSQISNNKTHKNPSNLKNTTTHPSRLLFSCTHTACSTYSTGDRYKRLSSHENREVRSLEHRPEGDEYLDFQCSAKLLRTSKTFCYK